MMSDLQPASILFLIFAIALLLYGAAMVKTGDGGLVPFQSAHSIRDRNDVKYLGRIVAIVGLIIGIVALALLLSAR
ncbi:MAG: hypothetical protein Q4B54_07630 [Coriobacteriales bacterium]|nr:hypothetical protein [Coriobacteriales bacterium]